MNLKIVNDNGDELPLPGWMLSEPDLKRRLGVEKRFGKAGGYITGDRETDARSLTLETDFTGRTDAEYKAQFDEFLRIVDKRFFPYFIIDLDNDIRFEAEFQRMSPNVQKGMEQRWAGIAIDLIMIESYWEDLVATEESSPSTGTPSGGTLSAENTGSVETFPIITISPTANNNAFTLFNNTIEDLISIGSSGFVPGTTITIDAQEGTVLLSDGTTSTDIDFTVADGTGFFVLAPGVNEIEYTSSFGSADITIEWRNRQPY